MVGDGRKDDGPTLEHGYVISSPCEPNDPDELKMYLRSVSSNDRIKHIIAKDMIQFR